MPGHRGDSSIWGHQASDGVTRSGVVYELFLTKLSQNAFTAADVVALYLHRGAFENALADEDLEQEPDRWCSHSPCGQEAWQVISQWIWNLRLELGHQLAPDPVRTTEFAPALPLRNRRLSRLLPLRGMGQRKWLCPGKLVASRGKTFPSSQMERCVALPVSRWWRMSGAEKPMGVCA